MLDIGAERLEAALAALNDQLTLSGSRVHLIVVGGSGLIAINAVSRVTQDVDVVALEVDDVFVSADPLPDAVSAAAATVARDLGLKHDWLNAGPTSLLIHGLPDGFADRMTSRDFGDFDDLRRLAPVGHVPTTCRGRRLQLLGRGPFDDAMARELTRCS